MSSRALMVLLMIAPLLAGCGRVGAVASLGGGVTAAAVVPATAIVPTTTPTIAPSPTASPSPTATLVPSPTPTATITPTPTATVTPSPTATPSPTPDPAAFVNGVPVEDFIVMPPETVENVGRIFARGRELGRNPRAFSKLGDSISLTGHYFARFDQDRYNLGIYAGLQPTIDYYSHSFERFGMALRIGLHAWIPFRPGLADETECLPDEHMVACELRLHNPSVLLIRLGTNDTAPGDAYERAIRHAINYGVHNGVIPVLVTKSDRFEGDNRHNETLRALAAEYAVPLWDFDVVAGSLPNRGLGGDGVHLTMYGGDDYSDPTALTYGYPLSDLTGLMMLDAIRRIVEEPGQ